MGLRCERCGSGEHVRNGLTRGKQRYRCKACGPNFTDTPPRGMPLRIKVEAVLLYLSGLSMNRTAKLLGVSTPSVQAWIERFAEVYAQKPEPEGRAVVVELDEMWHFLTLLRQVCFQPQQTRAFCARSPPSQAIAEQAPSRGRGRVVLGSTCRTTGGGSRWHGSPSTSACPPPGRPSRTRDSS